jgi:hypothetical protein
MPRRQLLLATVSFGLCFAAWGLVGAFAPTWREELGLGGQATSLLIAVPVLLGSLVRLPMGMRRRRRDRDRAPRAELRHAPRLCVLPGPGRVVVCHRRGVRVALVPSGAAGHGPRLLRPRHDGAVRGGVPRAGRGRHGRARRGVLRPGRDPPGVEPGLLGVCPCLADPQGPLDAPGDGGCAHEGATGLGALGLLLRHLRRVRRLLGIPAHAPARRLRPHAGRRGLPRCRVRGARDADAPARRHPGRQGRRASCRPRSC